MSNQDITLEPRLLDIGVSGDIEQFVAEHHEHLVSHHPLAKGSSLSMRPPSPGSLAAEIRDSPSYPPSGTLEKSKYLLSEKHSEFGSCMSSSESESEMNKGAFKSMNDKKRGWKKKRKLSITPNKEDLLKKQK